VKTRITRSGLELLKRLDPTVRELHKRQFAHMAAVRVRTLAELLGEICAEDSR